jgi:deoxyribodipyrimidine photo-lyase
MQNKINFTTKYTEIIEKIESINPITYGRTRNNLDGAVTHISPYLTHGVISLPQVRDVVLQRYTAKDSYTFIFELAWREFFQRVYMEEGNNIYSDLKSPQVGVRRYGIPQAILDTNTGITAIDRAYRELIDTGYMHNHARMWAAMLVTNVGHYEWWHSSRHLFYHLLDGDKASNSLSWQWVAGTFSSKQYVANQEMINKFSDLKQKDSYLNIDTSELTACSPKILEDETGFNLNTDFTLFENTKKLEDLTGESFMLYSIWTLDPVWEPGQNTSTKILFVDKEELTDFPISPKRISFIQELAKNISDLYLVIGTQEDLLEWSKIQGKCIYRKDHPALYDWPGVVSSPEYLFPEISKVPRGFMSFWKKCEPYLNN